MNSPTQENNMAKASTKAKSGTKSKNSSKSSTKAKASSAPKVPEMKFKTGKAGDVAAVKKSLERADYGKFLFLKADSTRRFRIMENPPEWDYFDKFWPDWGRKHADFEGCPTGQAGERSQRVYYFKVVEMDDEGQPKAIWLYEPPKSVMQAIVKRYENKGDVTDRDCLVEREGSSKTDTKYFVDWEDKKQLPKSKVAKLDDVDLLAEFTRMWDEHVAHCEKNGTDLYGQPLDEEDEDEEETPRSKSSSKSKSRKSPVEDDEEDEDEEEGDDDEEETDEDESEDDDADGDDEEGDDEDEDGDERPDLDDLDIDELKALAKELGVKVKSGSKSPGYRKAINAFWEEQDEDEEEPEDDDAEEADDDAEEGDDDGDEAEEDEGEEDEEGDDDGDEADEVTSEFKLDGVDEDEGYLTLTDTKTDTEYEKVYFDEGDIPGTPKVGTVYAGTILKDEDGDWLASDEPFTKVAAKGGKAKSKGKGKK